ncbi:TIGR01777 family oxidoreductase [Marinoscillum furvescens]|uniref:TIGR01777 family protein n=1 Tax=Marinoscillum furvescens DSM 4134 TaxID=1122208 RepID=A0A3D9L4F0_MARFU|nr:TIGR01777 family oxidoreductase [Marinoscillum furvescens]REE00483.1 hypothetical protein C7460_105106 [Marinoscillum furvescens DSM 4134]
MTKILITGGSGLVGSHLSQMLAASGYDVRHLSRSVTGKEQFPTFEWDIAARHIDPLALEGVTHIIHLAGAGVADKKWSPARKKVIVDSRVESTELLRQKVAELDVGLQQFISASAIGIYGADTGDQIVDEEAPHGSDFLAEVVEKWEAAADHFQDITQVAKVRIGVVLSEKGGAMVEVLKPVKAYVGAPLGRGTQYMSWIHIEDLCQIFKYVLEQQLTGTYNATAPNPVTNEALTKSLAKATGRPMFLPNVPAFVMRLMLGEMAQIVLGGNRVSCEKIQSQGYQFKFTNVESAVNDLLTAK